LAFYYRFYTGRNAFPVRVASAQVIAIVILIAIIALAIKNKVRFIKKTDIKVKEEGEVGEGKQ
jgi:hypothetical protein